MFTTANLTELSQLFNAAHGDPHHVLGLHEITYKGKDALTIRAFIPQAKSISIVDANDESFSRKLAKVHYDGFFETVIPDRDKWFRYKLCVENDVPNDDGESCWQTYDPYSFSPVLTDFDLQLIGEGTHYQIFDRLGAHIMDIDGISGVLFTVWAPSAKRVSVVGEFNNWDGRRAQMRLLQQSSGVWELFIPGLCENDMYSFEILTYSGQIIQRSDPYANSYEPQPGICAIINNLDSYKWNDESWVAGRSGNDPLKRPINIYQAHLDSWKRNKGKDLPLSYKELAENLIPYIKEMAYTHIELLPVMEYPSADSLGYQPSGFFAPTSRYGAPEDFMYFIDKCHQNEIGVIMEWVPSGFSVGCASLALFDGAPVYEYGDMRLGATGVRLFNYGRNEVRNFLIGSALFWIEKYHIDGIKVDGVSSLLYNTNGGFPNKYGGAENLEAAEFIKHMNSIINKLHKNVLIISDDSGSWANVSRPVDKDGLGFSLKWNTGWKNDFMSYITKETVYRRYHHNNLTFSMTYAHTENFVLALPYDEMSNGKGSLIGKMPGDLWQKSANIRLSLGFMSAYPGKNLVFMGTEFGQFVEWDCNSELDWFLLESDLHNQLREFVKSLNRLYRRERAFWYNDFNDEGFEWIDSNDANRSILSFIRKTDEPEETLVFLCNFTPEPVMSHRIGVPYEYYYEEILNSDSEAYGGGGLKNEGLLRAERIESDGREFSISASLPPLGIVVLKAKK